MKTDDREYIKILRRKVETADKIALKSYIKALLDWVERLLTELGR